MAAKGSESCDVRAGGFCAAHGHRIRDGGSTCSVRRAWEKTQCACSVCNKLTPRSTAKTLNPRMIAFRSAGKLEHGFVKELSLEEMEFWVTLSACPEGEGVCLACVEHATKILRGECMCTRLPEYEFELVPLFEPMVREKSETLASQTQVAEHPAVTLARMILSGRDPEHRAHKDPGGDGTECIVAANHRGKIPDNCQEYGDWVGMPTISKPTKDGSKPRAHYGFCEACAEKVQRAGIQMGPDLREMITGKKMPVIYGGTIDMGSSKLAVIERELRPSVQEPMLPSNVRTLGREACSMAPTMLIGDPRERLEFVPWFDPEDFQNAEDCFTALAETRDRYHELIVLHASPADDEEPGDFDSLSNTAKDDAKRTAKACPLHGKEMEQLDRYRFQVITHGKELWHERFAFMNKARHDGSYLAKPKPKKKRTIAEQNERKAARAERDKAAYPPGPARNDDSKIHRRGKGGKQ